LDGPLAWAGLVSGLQPIKATHYIFSAAPACFGSIDRKHESGEQLMFSTVLRKQDIFLQIGHTVLPDVSDRKNEGNSKAVCQEKNSSCHPLVPSFLLPLVLRLRHAGPVAPWVRGPPTQMSRDTGLSESGAAGTEFQLWTNLNLLWNFPAIKHGWKVRTVDELKVALWKAKNLD